MRTSKIAGSPHRDDRDPDHRKPAEEFTRPTHFKLQAPSIPGGFVTLRHLSPLL
jgi:hypothetical protein